MFICTTALTLVVAVYDFINALPAGVRQAIGGDAIQQFVLRFLPFSGIGLGWLCPALLGFVIGLVIYLIRKSKKAVA